MKRKRIRILLSGYGNIGTYMYEELKPLLRSQIVEITIFDPNKYLNGSMFTGETYHASDLEDIKHTVYDIAFICVPTDMLEDGSADTTIVQWNLDNIHAMTYVIKSTIPLEFVKKIENRDDIVYYPEYWGTTAHSSTTQNFMILGGNRKSCNKIYELYTKMKNGSFKFIFTSMRAAAIAKYMENCWIATKVTFCNDFAELARTWGVDYEDVRQCFISDDRVSPSHTYAFEDQPYYDSHCLNKDIPAIIADTDKQFKDCGLLPLVKSVKNINNIRKGL